ncbi:MAG: lysostaphin resistance A-like protein [Candidatus Sulfotelmatobacter sp.]
MSELEIKPESVPPPGTPAAKAAPDFSAASQPSYARSLFLGQEGLRPGWGVVLYFAMFFLLQRLAVDFAWSRNYGASDLWSEMLEAFGILLAAVIPALVLARVERRPWRVYGLPARRAFGKLFWLGALWGFAGISLLIFSLHELNAFDFGHLALHGVRIAKFTLFWALMFLLVGLSEEFRFRGYPQFTLARGVGFWPSALFLSAVFGMIHLGNKGEDWAGALAAACIGFFFCLTLRRTGNLWFAVGFHAAWDWGETFFYSVPDSGSAWPGHLLSSSLHGKPWLTGGSVGPEGSVLCFVVIGVIWMVFARAYPANRDRALPSRRQP